MKMITEGFRYKRVFIFMPPLGLLKLPQAVLLRQFMLLLSDFFVWIEALCPSQQFFSHVWTFSWVEPVPSNEEKVSCSRTQHRGAPLVNFEPSTLQSRFWHSTN